MLICLLPSLRIAVHVYALPFNKGSVAGSGPLLGEQKVQYIGGVRAATQGAKGAVHGRPVAVCLAHIEVRLPVDEDSDRTGVAFANGVVQRAAPVRSRVDSSLSPMRPPWHSFTQRVNRHSIQNTSIGNIAQQKA